MSENDKKKEQQESEAFLEASLISQADAHTHIITKKILEHLYGKPVIRKKNDSPDLIFEKIDEFDRRYVGIEIFSVDQDSIRKGKSYRSESKENKAKLYRIHSKMRRQIDETGFISEDVENENLAATFDYAKGHVNSGYNNFIDAFRFHFEKHANNISKYRSNIDSEANGHGIELAFFIEIEAEITDWFFNPINNKPFEKVNNMPFFVEMISIINSIENINLLDYMVFYIHDISKKNKQVVAIETSNIKKQLKEQNITVYHYVGEHGVSAKICGTASEWSVTLKPDRSVEKDIMPLYFQAVQMKKDNLPFVTSREIQHLLYICPYAQDKNEFRSYLHLLGKDKVHQLSKEFSTLYGNKR